MKTLEKIKAHPAFESFSDERSAGDGFWVYLKAGWIDTESDCCAVHEDSPLKCYQKMKWYVKRVQP